MKVNESQITNLSSGDCCSTGFVTIPIALLSLLEGNMKTASQMLPKLNELAKEKGWILSADGSEESEMAAHIYNIEESLELWAESKCHFEKKLGIEWPEIEHNNH